MPLTTLLTVPVLCGALIGAHVDTVNVADAEPMPVEAPLQVASTPERPEEALDVTAPPLSIAEQEVVEWALGRFELVGLEVPHVVIEFHDHTRDCGGNKGRFRGDGDRRRIDVCVADHSSFASNLERRRTLIHELAHAWDHATLTPEERHELLDVLAVDDWYDHDVAWDERGVERLAETLVWGLYDQRRRLVLIDVPCAELNADFRRITGMSALGPIEQVCETATNPDTHQEDPS